MARNFARSSTGSVGVLGDGEHPGDVVEERQLAVEEALGAAAASSNPTRRVGVADRRLPNATSTPATGRFYRWPKSPISRASRPVHSLFTSAAGAFRGSGRERDGTGVS